MVSTMIRRLAAAGLSALAVATAACGGGDDGGATGPSSPAATSGFAITNGSDREAWYIYSRACGSETWGEDELGSANILYPGESVNWEESAGCYDLLALTSLSDSPRYQALYQGKTVASGATTSFSIANGDWTAVVDVRVASARK